MPETRRDEQQHCVLRSPASTLGDCYIFLLPGQTQEDPCPFQNLKCFFDQVYMGPRWNPWKHICLFVCLVGWFFWDKADSASKDLSGDRPVWVLQCRGFTYQERRGNSGFPEMIETHTPHSPMCHSASNLLNWNIEAGMERTHSWSIGGMEFPSVVASGVSLQPCPCRLSNLPSLLVSLRPLHYL